MLTEKAPSELVRANRWLKVAAGIVLFVAGFNLMVGLAALLIKPDAAPPVNIGYESIVAGVLFLVLGVFVWRRSALALGIAVALLAGEGVWRVIEAWGKDGSPIALGGFALRLLLIFLMLPGIGAIRLLKQSRPDASREGLDNAP